MDIQKKYKISCTASVIRHEVTVSGRLFKKAAEVTSDILETIYDSYEDAEKQISQYINEDVKHYERRYDDTKIEILQSNFIKIEDFSARVRNYYREISNRKISRKKEPLFTVYKYYTVVEIYVPNINEFEKPNHYDEDWWS